jgi:accessory gene regulator B
MMILRLSERISYFLQSERLIRQEDRKVYAYGFEILLSTVLNLFAVGVIAFLSGRLLESICYLAAFIPLRSLIGGFHAKNHSRCFLILMMVYGAFLFLLKNFPDAHFGPAVFICGICSTIIVFFLAPVADANKPLSSSEKKAFQKKSRIAVIAYTLATMLAFTCITEKIWPFSASLGVMTCAISLIAGKIKGIGQKHFLGYDKK